MDIFSKLETFAYRNIVVPMQGKATFDFVENNYKGHGLREQAKELERCVKNNLIESPKMKHSDSLEVMESMDKIRDLVGLNF